MKIGIVSDTHDHFDKAEKAAEFFDDRVEKVVHCGDMICPASAEIFEREFDFYAVRGNNDGEWDLKETVEEFGNFYSNIAELNFSEQKIAVYHGTEEEIADSLVKCGKYDYVFRGHTHEKKVREIDGTVEINPGGIRLPFQDEKIHAVILDPDTGEFEFHRIEA
jgi:putative phosphoesterase